VRSMVRRRNLRGRVSRLDLWAEVSEIRRFNEASAQLGVGLDLFEISIFIGFLCL
jgi:hypothetical protein